MKKVFLFAIAASMLLFGCSTEQEHSFAPYRLSEAEKEKLRDGDIILRYGEGFASDMIVKLLDEERKISHCGILSKKADGSFQVIHSVSSSLSDADGMQAQDLDEFVSQSVDSSVMVVRYKEEESTASSSRIAERAKAYLKARLPFDSEFDLEDDEAIYCTELIERTIREVHGHSLIEADPEDPYSHLHFEVFWNSENLRTIIDHHR